MKILSRFRQFSNRAELELLVFEMFEFFFGSWAKSQNPLDRLLHFMRLPVDLSNIVGIGPALAKALHSVGVFKMKHCRNIFDETVARNMHVSLKERNKIMKKVRTALKCTIHNGRCPFELEYVDHSKADNPYLSKYGPDEWQKRIAKSKTLSGNVCITDAIYHMATTTTNAMKETLYEGKGLFSMTHLPNCARRIQLNG